MLEPEEKELPPVEVFAVIVIDRGSPEEGEEREIFPQARVELAFPETTREEVSKIWPASEGFEVVQAISVDVDTRHEDLSDGLKALNILSQGEDNPLAGVLEHIMTEAFQAGVDFQRKHPDFVHLPY